MKIGRCNLKRTKLPMMNVLRQGHQQIIDDTHTHTRTQLKGTIYPIQHRNEREKKTGHTANVYTRRAELYRGRAVCVLCVRHRER